LLRSARRIASNTSSSSTGLGSRIRRRTFSDSAPAPAKRRRRKIRRHGGDEPGDGLGRGGEGTQPRFPAPSLECGKVGPIAAERVFGVGPFKGFQKGQAALALVIQEERRRAAASRLFDRSWPTPGAVRVHRPRFAAFYFCVGRPIPARCRASGNVFSDDRQSLPERVLASQRVPAGTGPILRR